MGMATIQARVKPWPKYKGTVVCDHCFAEYRPGNWVKGYTEGTQSDFHMTNKIPEGHCPICGIAEGSS